MGRPDNKGQHKHTRNRKRHQRRAHRRDTGCCRHWQARRDARNRRPAMPGILDSGQAKGICRLQGQRDAAIPACGQRHHARVFHNGKRQGAAVGQTKQRACRICRIRTDKGCQRQCVPLYGSRIQKTGLQHKSRAAQRRKLRCARKARANSGDRAPGRKGAHTEPHALGKR